MLTLFSFNRSLHLAMPLLSGIGSGLMLYFSTSNSASKPAFLMKMRGRVHGPSGR